MRADRPWGDDGPQVYLHLQRGDPERKAHCGQLVSARQGRGLSHICVTKCISRPTLSHARGVLGIMLQYDSLGHVSLDQAPFHVMVNTDG